MVDFAVAAAMLVVLMFICHRVPSWPVLLLPIWMAILLMAALGVGLCTAALAVSYRDVQYILPVALQALLYASPVAYASGRRNCKAHSPLATAPLPSQPPCYAAGSLSLVDPRYNPAPWPASRLRRFRRV